MADTDNGNAGDVAGERPAMTTLEKIHALVAALMETPKDELAGDAAQFVEALSIARGLGIDPLGFLIPQTPAEADVFVDKAIALLLQVRGDDLPPFDPERYGEAAATEA